MIFTSYTYVLFLLAAFVLHWSLPTSWRKMFLILASYVFYCSWHWEFGFLLLGVSLFNWSYARWILTRFQTMPVLVLGIAVNVLALLYFKYPAFIIDNVTTLANALGMGWHPDVEAILRHMGCPWDPDKNDFVPVLGISFFTFQGVAYLFDVATGDEPLTKLTDFLLFKALWPQLIAGPIIRLHEIRAQITGPRQLDYQDVAEGSWRILQGFFKKMVLADNLASTVEMVFRSTTAPNFVDCVTGVLGFGMQIYFDFSAYSDIAIGTARLFGFRFPENFNWPYVSRSPREFWNRWHMSLSRWIRDYLFTPMSFAARNRPALAPLWLLIAMALCGLWHGAAWTFVVWGLWHGVLLALNQTVLKRFFPLSREEKPDTPWWRALPAIVITFVLVQVGWVFFRARSFALAWGMIRSLATFQGGLRPSTVRENAVLFVGLMFLGMLIAQALYRWAPKVDRSILLVDIGVRIFQPALYAAMILAVIIFDQEAKTFVYFQF